MTAKIGLMILTKIKKRKSDFFRTSVLFYHFFLKPSLRDTLLLKMRFSGVLSLSKQK